MHNLISIIQGQLKSHSMNYFLSFLSQLFYRFFNILIIFTHLVSTRECNLNYMIHVLNMILFLAWDDGQPNGGTGENCAYVSSGVVNWQDYNCATSLISVCKVITTDIHLLAQYPNLIYMKSISYFFLHSFLRSIKPLASIVPIPFLYQLPDRVI